MQKSGKKVWIRRALSGMMILSLCISLFGVLPMISAAAYSTGNDSVSEFSASCDGSALNLSLKGRTHYSDNLSVVLRAADDSTETYQLIISDSIQFTQNRTPVSGSTGSIERDNSAEGNWGEAYTGTVSIPLSALPFESFSLEFAGISISAAELGLPEEPVESEPEASDVESQPESSGTEQDPSSSPESKPEDPTAGRTPNTGGRIVVDGDASDWKNVTALTLPGGSDQGIRVDSLKTAVDTEGNVYLCLEGMANQYSLPNAGWIMVDITQNGVTQPVSLNQLLEAGGQLRTGGQVGDTEGAVCVEVSIPAGYFTDGNFAISYQNVNVSAADMAVMDGVPVSEEEPVYNGIVIDGSFADWGAVTKYPGNDPKGNLKSASAVFDGDWVYLYFEESQNGNASAAGSHGNGKYSIKTDLGYELLVQLNPDGTVSCPAENASCRHVGTQWEVAIPASALPAYQNTFDFGLYLHDPIVTGVANLNGQGSGGTFEGITYDGLYGDWTYYPHTTIEYNTAGTGETITDATGALYASGSSLYGHVKTNMETHLADGGGELSKAFTVRFNVNESTELHVRLVSVGADGSIDYLTSTEGLPAGTYEFYMVDERDSQDLGNINNSDNPWYDQLAPYGKMMITVSDTMDEGEFVIDLEKVAKRLGLSSSELKTIAARFGRLGDKWITISGTPTGAWLGVLLCIVFVLGVALFRRQKKNRPEA